MRFNFPFRSKKVKFKPQGRVVYLGSTRRSAVQRIESFLFLHKIEFLVFFVIALVIFGLVSARADVLLMYPELCDGGWRNSENAQGVPSLEKGASAGEFNEDNSAMYEGGSSLRCASFVLTGPVREAEKISSVKLRFSLVAISSEDLMKREPGVFFPEESVEDESSENEEQESVSTPSEEEGSVAPKPESEQEEVEVSDEPASSSSEARSNSIFDRFVLLLSNIAFAQEGEGGSKPVEQLEAEADSEVEVEPEVEAEPEDAEVKEGEASLGEVLGDSDDQSADEGSEAVLSPEVDEEEGEETASSTEPSVTSQEDVVEPEPESQLTEVEEESEALEPESVQDTEKDAVEPEAEEEKNDDAEEGAEIEEKELAEPKDLKGFLEVMYSFGGQNWHSLGFINENNWKDISFDLAVNSAQELATLEVQLVPVLSADTPPIVYLDGIIVDVVTEALPDLDKQRTMIALNEPRRGLPEFSEQAFFTVSRTDSQCAIKPFSKTLTAPGYVDYHLQFSEIEEKFPFRVVLGSIPKGTEAQFIYEEGSSFITLRISAYYGAREGSFGLQMLTEKFVKKEVIRNKCLINIEIRG